MFNSQRFCDITRNEYNTSTDHETCNYPDNPEPITGPPSRPSENSNRMMNPKPSLIPIYGTVVDVIADYFNSQTDCVSNYNITVRTKDNQEIHFIIDADTYFVDCVTQQKGINIVGFYNEFAAIPLIYPPQYPIKVIALDLPGRYIKADFFDCYLVSNDNQLQLLVSNNTYIIDEDGALYCGNISNKYMVALYANSTDSIPSITTPNVIIVLH